MTSPVTALGLSFLLLKRSPIVPSHGLTPEVPSTVAPCVEVFNKRRQKNTAEMPVHELHMAAECNVSQPEGRREGTGT